jgi:hypothetical protein
MLAIPEVEVTPTARGERKDTPPLGDAGGAKSPGNNGLVCCAALENENAPDAAGPVGPTLGSSGDVTGGLKLFPRCTTA